MTAVVRRAAPADAAFIHALVVELAVYERLAHEVRATPDALGTALFGAAPRAFCDIVEWDGQPVGLALWFYSFSTFEGRHGIHLEDLYVRPEHRGLGLGRALLAGLARRCVEEGLPRLQWNVLDWNEPALRFYRGLGAVPLDGWIGCRLGGDALSRLAGPRP